MFESVSLSHRGAAGIEKMDIHIFLSKQYIGFML